MSVNRSYRPAYIMLRDPQADCPNKDCDGWLSVHGTARDRVPIFITCSNKNNKNGFKCNQATIFSKRESEIRSEVDAVEANAGSVEGYMEFGGGSTSEEDVSSSQDSTF
eukprot:gene30927-38222_t